MGKDTKKKKSPKKKVTRQKGLQATRRNVDLKPGQGFVNADGQLQMERSDLLEVENLRLKAEERKKAAINAHKEAELKELNARIEIKTLRQTALAIEQEERVFRKQLSNLFTSFNSKYGVDFLQCTYDDETGIITVIDQIEQKKEEEKKEGAKAPDKSSN